MKLSIGGNLAQKQEPNAVEGDNAWVYTQIWSLPFRRSGD